MLKWNKTQKIIKIQCSSRNQTSQDPRSSVFTNHRTNGYSFRRSGLFSGTLLSNEGTEDIELVTGRGDVARQNRHLTEDGGAPPRVQDFNSDEITILPLPQKADQVKEIDATHNTTNPKKKELVNLAENLVDLESHNDSNNELPFHILPRSSNARHQPTEASSVNKGHKSKRYVTINRLTR